MSLTCIKVVDSSDLSGVVEEADQDFWVTCFSAVSPQEFPDKVPSLKVDEILAMDAFTHCYYCAADDVKAATDDIFERHGLGLRKSRVKSKNNWGTVCCFVNKTRRSTVYQSRESLDSTNKKLSTEERVRRCHMSMHVVTLKHIMEEATRNRSSFWLTNWSQTSAEQGKRKVVCTQIEGQQAQERFARALLADVNNCQEAVQQVHNKCGMGLRKGNCRARSEPGCVCLLLTPNALNPLPLPGPSTSPGVQAMVGAAAPAPPMAPDSPGPKRRKVESTEPVPAAAPRHEPVSAPMGRSCSPAEDEGAAMGSEDLLYRQYKVIRKRLFKNVMPSIPQEQWNTTHIMERLEDEMKKPRGRLANFQQLVSVIWREYRDRESNLD